MILTITLNPALDLTLTVDGWQVGEVNRATAVTKSPGGKGINVSRVLKELSHPTTALTILGSDSVLEFQRLAKEAGFTIVYINRPGEIRINVQLMDLQKGEILKVNQPGVTVSKTHFNHFQLLYRQQLKTARFVSLGGSLPPGLDKNTYGLLVAQADRENIPTLVDAEEEALLEALPAGPTIAKPNRRELANTLQRPITSIAETFAGAERMVTLGAKTVVVTDGGGAVCAVHGGRRYLAYPPQIEVRSSVGAGDSLAAGLILRLVEGASFAEALAFGTACGAACCLTADGQLAEAQTIRTLLPKVAVKAL